jgi:predicted CoA-binding protein
MRKTVIVGATPNPNRYAFLAAEKLTEHGEAFVPIGIKSGHVFGQTILDLRTKPNISDVDTLTMYLNADHQREWTDYLLSLKPRRIIFNPGAENPEFTEKAKALGIETENACTLVMLATGVY